MGGADARPRGIEEQGGPRRQRARELQGRRAEGGVGAGGCDFCLPVLTGGMDLGMCWQGDR